MADQPAHSVTPKPDERFNFRSGEGGVRTIVVNHLSFGYILCTKTLARPIALYSSLWIIGSFKGIGKTIWKLQ